MSFRLLIRTVALALGLLLATPLLWKAAGPWALLAAPCLVLLASVYLLARVTLNNETFSRWQIRYQMEKRTPQVDERLEAILNFLAGRGAHLVLETNDQGLFLEAAPEYDRYIPAQLSRTLPEAKITQVRIAKPAPAATEQNLFLLTGRPEPGLLTWAAGAQDRQVRIHLRQGGCATMARTKNGTEPPGRWLPLRLPASLAAGTWRNLPFWDEMSAGAQAARLFPATGESTPFSSRSRLLRLTAAARFATEGRPLGLSPDGQPVALDQVAPLLTIGAPAAFLARQVIHDLEAGRAVIVISPHRRVLNQIQRQARTMTYWLDQENSRLSIHLAITAAAEWTGQASEIEAIVAAVETFLSDLGLDLRTTAMQTIARDLVRILASSAQATGNDFAFTDLYAVAQATGALKAFLNDLAGMATKLNAETVATVRHVLGLLDDRSGYVQVTAVLSTIRTALGTIRSGSLHNLCQPPFLNAGQALRGSSLVLVPTTNADFPEHNRFLAAMMGATLRRILATADGAQIALHLHDPQAYEADSGQSWLALAGQNPRLSLLLDVQDPGAGVPFQETRHGKSAGRLIFRCDQDLARVLVDQWSLDYTLAEMTEIPTGMALARLPGLPGPITINVDDTAPAVERQ